LKMPAASRKGLKQRRLSTTGWAMIICLLGMVLTFQPFVPWAKFWVLDEWRSNPQPLTEIHGYQAVFAIVAGGVFLAVFLAVVGKAIFKSRGRWEPYLIILAGIEVILLTVPAIPLDQSFVSLPTWVDYASVNVSGMDCRFVYTDAPAEVLAAGSAPLARLPRGGESLVLKLAIGFPAYCVLAFGVALSLLGTLQFRRGHDAS
jgi:hypothetical protein